MSNERNANPPMKRKKGPGGHGPMGMMPGEKAKNFKTTMKALLRYIKPFKFQVISVIIFAIASTIFSIVSPMILGGATDVVVNGVLGTGIDYSELKNMIIILICLYITSFCFSVLQSYIMAGISQNITYKLRKEISEKIDKLPLKYFDGKTHGEILSRVQVMWKQ